MAHLSLPNSELHVALSAVGSKGLEAVCRSEGTVLLFPTLDATDVEHLEYSPRQLVVVDGTWSNARKVVLHCPLLSALPRIAFRPNGKSRYRIRAEPDDAYVSTIEATALVLEKLERRPGAFRPILSAFDSMVERQLAFAASNQRKTRHARVKKRNTARVDPTASLRKAANDLVLIFGEANAWPQDALNAPAGDPELIQLVALRVSDGARFEAILEPARPLAPNVPNHLEVPLEHLLHAEARTDVFARWRSFLRPTDVLVGWGRYCHDLLSREHAAPASFIDVRSILCALQSQRPGSVEAYALRLGGAVVQRSGRALRRLDAVEAVVRALLEGRAEVARTSHHSGVLE